MKNGYELLILLTNTLNEATPFINSILKEGKEDFSSNEEKINIGIGFINEIKEIINALDKNIFILNPNLYSILEPIIEYSNNLFNHYKFVNAYKLYDSLQVDIVILKNFLNKVKGN